MKTKKIQKEVTLYISSDGKEFLSEQACKDRESYLKKVSNIKFFRVHHDIDKMETGDYFKQTLVAVLPPKELFLSSESLLINWGLKTFGSYLEDSVMGYGYQHTFPYSVITEEEWNNNEQYCVYGGWGYHTPEKVFISSEDINGFPKKYDPYTEWKIK